MKTYVEISISASESQREMLIPTMVELGCLGFEERESHLLCYLEKGMWERQDLKAGLLGLLRTISANAEISTREIEVIRLVADGRSNKWIGEQLSLSALTVKSHLARIGRKLGTGDRAHMVALAMRAGVIS